MALDTMKNSRLTSMTLSREFRVLDAMNNLGLWTICATSGHEVRAMDVMNNSTLWMVSMTWDPMSSHLYML